MTDFYTKSSAELKKLALEIERETVATIREYYPDAPTVLDDALAYIHEQEEEFAYVASEGVYTHHIVIAGEHFPYQAHAEHLIAWFKKGSSKVRAELQRALVNAVDQEVGRDYKEPFNKWVNDLLRRGYNTARISTLIRLLDELADAQGAYYFAIVLSIDGYRFPEVELETFATSEYDKYKMLERNAFIIE